jgi:hypothetical protein
MLVVLAGSCALADDQLDDMMNQMDAKRTHSGPAAAIQSAARQVVNTASNAWNSFLSSFSNVSTPPAQEEEDFDAIDSGNDQGESWSSNAWRDTAELVATAKETVRNFPFPHFYWAPGIVGDATERIFDKIDTEFFPEDN